MDNQRAPVFSVLIPALNEEANIEACISAIEQSIPSDISFEIIVGDHGSTDRTASLAEAANAKVIHKDGGTIAELRNDLALSAIGDVFIFMDADIRPKDKWRDNIKRCLSRVSVNPMTVTGSVCHPPDNDTFFNKYWFYPISSKPKKYIGTGHLIVSRDCFESIGGFNIGLSSGEDVDFCKAALRVGCLVEPMPELEVSHLDYPKNFSEFFRREIWHGVGDYHTFSEFIASPVAVLSALYAFFILLFVIATICLSEYFFIILAVVLLIPTLVSYYKFPGLKLSGRFQNIAICSAYLFARAISFFYKGARGRIYENKAVKSSSCPKGK